MSVEGEEEKQSSFHHGVNSCDVVSTAASARGSRTHSSHTVCASTQNNVVTWASVLGSDEFQQSGGRESVRMNRWVRIMALLDRAGQINHCVLSCSRNPTVQEVARSERKQTRDLCDKRGTKRRLIGFKSCFLHLKVFLIIHKLVLVSFFPFFRLHFDIISIYDTILLFIKPLWVPCVYCLWDTHTHTSPAHLFPLSFLQTTSSAPHSPGHLLSKLKLDRYSHLPSLKTDAWRRSS